MEEIPVVSVVGCSGSGKTTFLEKLIAELKRRGHRVGTVKHTDHAVALDRSGKDTWRHARAGAEVVALAAPNGVRLVREMPDPAPAEVVALLRGVDIVLTEGYKRGKWPKVLVYRSDAAPLPDKLPGGLLAVVSDVPLSTAAPRFDLSDAAGVAGLIEDKILKKARLVRSI